MPLAALFTEGRWSRGRVRFRGAESAESLCPGAPGALSEENGLRGADSVVEEGIDGKKV